MPITNSYKTFARKNLRQQTIDNYILQTLCRDRFSDNQNDAVPTTSTKVYCLRCPKLASNKTSDEPMQLEKLPEGSIVISNANLELVFDEETRLLSTVKDKRRNLTKEIKLKFGGYPTVQFRNGAYLFKPDANREPVAVIDPIGESFEHKFLFLEFLTFFPFSDNLKEVVVITGHVFSEISLIYEAGTSPANPGSFVHTVRLYHVQLDCPLGQGIYVENNFNFGDQNNFRDIDMFMRLESGLKNRHNQWFSDSSGLSMQRRLPASNISLEGNTYPITSMIYLEDHEARLSLLVDHATGASSQKQVCLIQWSHVR